MEACYQNRSPEDAEISCINSVIGNGYNCTTRRDEDWKKYLLEVGKAFDPEVNMISSREAAVYPELAVRIRAHILINTYKGDYHTDSFEIERLSKRIGEGCERVFFWGSSADIEQYRKFSREQVIPDDRQLSGIKLGTATFLDETEVYGDGYWELGRTGSITADVRATCPNITELMRILRENDSVQNFHTIVCMPRNRVSSNGVRGGAAIHRMQTRTIKSWFWGFAPWYVMQGGTIECLDYRELYPHPENILRVLKSRTPPLSFLLEREANYARALVDANISKSELKILTVSAENAQKYVDTPHWHSISCSDRSLQKFNPAIFRFDVTKPGLPLASALEVSEDNNPACQIFYLPLLPQMTEVQAWLSARKYILSALVPPKVCSDPWVGQWIRPNTNFEITVPHYAQNRQLNTAEKTIVDYMRTFIANRDA